MLAVPGAEMAHAPVAGPSRAKPLTVEPAQRVIDADAALEASQAFQFFDRASFILIGLDRKVADRAFAATRWLNGDGIRPQFQDRFSVAFNQLLEHERDKVRHTENMDATEVIDTKTRKKSLKSAAESRKVVQFVDLADDEEDPDVETHQPFASSSKIGRAFGVSLEPDRAGGAFRKTARKSWPNEPAPLGPLDTVLTVFPDIDPEHVRTLLSDAKHNNSAESVVEALLSSKNYPKVATKGKKRAREEETDARPRRNYLDKDRPALDRESETAALLRLCDDFPFVAVNKVEQVFRDNNKHFAPTYIALDSALQQTDADRGWKCIRNPRRPKGKNTTFLATLEQERHWVLDHIREKLQAELREKELAQKLEQEIKDGAFFECGCCFGDCALSTLVMCSSGHSFCKDCAVANAESQIGMRKYEDHLPMTCEEAEADDKITSIHKVEEAMSAALIRKCPQCSEPFVKEDGCNKMRCPSCQTLSCYICRKIISGYDHFAQAGTNARNPDLNSKCNLWDDSVKRNYDEVEAARIEAAKVVAKEDPRIKDVDLEKLNLPKPPPKPANPYYDAYGQYVPAPPPVLDPRMQARLREEEERRRAAQLQRDRETRQRLEAERRRIEETARAKEAEREAKRQKFTGQKRR
ncbi:hypothetical protein OIV83_002169 [Microbotryomycetes sp. JL201]|nr:hypothetical protein OIV83_002169 [Microbotryomycetes sp. JL201]